MSAAKTLRVYALCLTVALFSACESETVVTKIDPSKPTTQKSEGVLFSLPETVVVAEVPLTKTASSPGAFAKWAEFFYPELTPDNYATEEKTAFKVGAPTFTTRGQTDPNHVYMAHIKAKKFETKTLLVEFNDDGIIARTETSSKDESIDIITSGIKTAVSIAAPLLRVGAGGAPFVGGDKTTAVCDEACFRETLSVKDKYLFDSLDSNYKAFLEQKLGYPLLGYLAVLNNDNIDFFLTLNQKQREIIGGTPARPRTLTWEEKLELVRAKAAYDKIEELILKREELVEKDTNAGVTTSTNVELKLRELDAKIKATKEIYFLGSSSDTAATAKFEFKPSSGVAGDQTRNFFTYAAGGAKPGICTVEAEVPGVFKATWPKNLEGACHASSPNFAAGDFRDLKALAAKLNGGAGGVAAGADAVTAYLYTSKLPTARALLANTATPQQRDALLRALIADLNSMVNGGTRLDTLVSFDAVRLSADTLELMNKAAVMAPADIPKFNRLLLEDAYSDFFHRLKASASHQVALVVNAAPAGIAQTINNAQLKQDGKRGFPYRVPALTLARLTDDGKEKGRGEVRVAQFGPVQTLPAGLGGRRSAYTITYYDASGAIKTFNMSADALIQKQNVTDLTDAATTLRDAEAARLKRETDLLKARKDKLVAEKALKDAQEETEPAAEPAATPTPE